MLLLATRSCAPSKKIHEKKNNLSTSFFAKAAAGQQKRPKNDSVKYELAGSGQLPTPLYPLSPLPLQATLCKCNLQLLYTLLIKFGLQ